MTVVGVDRLSARKLQSAINQAPDRLFRNLRGALRDAGARWEGAMGRRLRGSPLKRRTGNLARSIRQQVRGSNLRSLELRAATTARYAKVQEFGTVGAGGRLPDITPKRGKYLTVPLRDNLTGAGVPRYPSAAALRESGSTFVLKAGGKLFIVQRTGSDLRWLWVLKRKVALPPRLGFFATWRGQARERSIAFDRAVVATLTGKERG